MPPRDPRPSPYDATFFDRQMGPVPYRREEGVWLRLFGELATSIVEQVAPARVLDVGCAKGFLVEALRGQGVEAFGVDPSSYAVSEAHADVADYLTVGDVRDLPRESYDLVTCLEVLEHLPPSDAQAVIEALVARGTRVLFSSTPDDYDEPTHVNVQPVRHWIERFAEAGYAPVPGADFSAFAPHAMLFQAGAASEVERRLYADWIERGLELSAARTRQAAAETLAFQAQTNHAADLDTAAGRAALRLRDLRAAIAPDGSQRERALRGVAHRLLRARPARRLGFDPAALENDPRRPRLLVVSGCGGDSRRYRCDHLLEAATAIGGSGAIVDDDPQRLHAGRRGLHDCADVLVLHRARATEPLRALIDAARAAGALVVFDTDDLTIDPALDLDSVPGLAALIDAGAVAAQRAALDLADAALCTNAFLAERLATGARPAHVLRNGWSGAMRQAADAARPRPSSPGVVGYASGTSTHDADFAQCAGSVADLLDADARRELHLIGPLDPGGRLRRVGRRVRSHAFVPWRALPQLLIRFDVNLAPLDLATPFCRSKSELKWLEAALVGVPTVASPAPAFAAAITPGRDGLLAATPSEWRDQLQALLTDPERAASIGAAAKARVLADYGPAQRGETLRAILASLGYTP